jgi:hypothetical protein
MSVWRGLRVRLLVKRLEVGTCSLVVDASHFLRGQTDRDTPTIFLVRSSSESHHFDRYIDTWIHALNR